MSETVDCRNHSEPNSIDQIDRNAVRFSSLEEMQAASEAEGWSIEYRQLQAGALTARTVAGTCGNISLLDEYASQRLEIAGETPQECVTVLVPACEGTEIRVNGKSLDCRSIFLLDSQSECQTVTSQDTHVLSMHIAKSSLLETGRDLFETWEWRAGRDGTLIEYGGTQVQHLRSLMHAAIYQPVNGHWQMEQASTLLSVLAAIINQGFGAQAQTKHTSAAESLRTIRCAREFVEANLTEPIQINEICSQSATSVSKLERTFRRELRMSPSQYILVRRLDVARRELKLASSNGNQIARIATDCGFNHLGRFAGAYRTQFGELPSETVRSS